MHKICNKLNLHSNIADLFLQETYTGTETSRPSWPSMRVSAHVHHTGLGLGGSVRMYEYGTTVVPVKAYFLCKFEITEIYALGKSTFS